MKHKLVLWLAFACAGTWGCGGDSGADPLFTPENTGGGESGGSSGPVHERGDASVQVTVGPAGGVLELSNGAKLEIPAGALGDSVDVIFGVGSSTQAFANRENERTLGPALLIQPALIAQPGARIKISAPVGPIPQPFTEDDVTLATETVDEMDPMSDVRPTVQTIWQYASASVEGGRLVAELQELPGMRVQFLLSRDE
jgi:hypothetical protein